jgi:crossover junction endodeoxyribonuclease RuvC
VVVLGIDPGSQWCGYGVVARQGSRLARVTSGVIVPGKRPMGERLAYILEELSRVIAGSGVDEVSIESVFAGASARSALVLGQARGVAMAAAALAHLPIYEYAPSEVKLAFTGSGRADKAQMMRMAHALFGATPDRSDEADALALAVCHLAKRAGKEGVRACSATPRKPVRAPLLRPARRPPEVR